MPNFEPVVLQGDKYAIRHVGPRGAVWVNSPAANIPVLGRPDMVARWLPSSNQPDSPDFATGSWTGRLGDSGESTITFPNGEASDGVPWRQRFDPTGHLQWIEIYYNNDLDSVCVVDKIPTIDEQQVQIHGADGFWILNKAYERDWIITAAPRDVIERGTRMWVPYVADNFPSSGTRLIGTSPAFTGVDTPFANWAVAVLDSAYAGVATVTSPPPTIVLQQVGPPSSGVELYTISSTTTTEQVTLTSPSYTTSSSYTWRAIFNIANVTSLGNATLALIVNSVGVTFSLALSNDSASLNGSLSSAIPASTTYSLMLESDGRWIWGFVNGRCVGCRQAAAPLTTFNVGLQLTQPPAAMAQVVKTAVLQSVLVDVMEPFLMRGTDKGDYVLPGNASTYPNGGLHARYFIDTDIQSSTVTPPLLTVLNPTRTQAYGATSSYEYMNQQDPQVFGQDPPGFTQTNPGYGSAANSEWSCVWFGAIWLPLATIGNIGMQLNIPSDCAARVWVGNLQYGAQMIGTPNTVGSAGDGWTYSNTGGYSMLFEVSAASLAGTPPYDGTPVAKDGWYPIKIEFSVPSGAPSAAPSLYFVFGSSFGSYMPLAASWKDPGGTTIAQNTGSGGGAGYMVVPATSLSPLGCVDQRYQGISHFSLVQQTAQAFGYQVSVQPKQLESGLFPGTLAPRAPNPNTGVGQGMATDIVLQPDSTLRTAGEGLLNYSSGLDATDFAASLWGNGAGFQNGNTGQLQGNVFDPGTVMGSLFDVQQWQDFSDASFSDLLGALLNSQLGLQLTPWQLLSADPKGRPRETYQWPLPSAVAAMRWRAGDAVLIRAVDLNVFDTVPRQMLTFTRNMLPNGIASSQAQFAQRPRTPAHTIKQQLFKVTRLGRNYQRQKTTLMGSYADDYYSGSVPAGAVDGVFSLVTLGPGDQVVHAEVRVTQATQEFGIAVNGVDETSALGGPWSAANLPVIVNLNSLATVASNGSYMYVALVNKGGSAAYYGYQLSIDVVR